MMQGNSKKKMGSLIAAVAIIVLVVALIAAFVLLINGEEVGAGGILWIYVAVLAAVVIGVLIALRQRFKEISKGEEDEAKKY